MGSSVGSYTRLFDRICYLIRQCAGTLYKDSIFKSGKLSQEILLKTLSSDIVWKILEISVYTKVETTDPYIFCLVNVFVQHVYIKFRAL